MGRCCQGLNIQPLNFIQFLFSQGKTTVRWPHHFRCAGKGDPGLFRTTGNHLEHLQLGRVEVVEPVHNQKANISQCFLLGFERLERLPAQTLKVRPAQLRQLRLIFAINPCQNYP